MPKEIVADIAESFLKTGTEFSDRIVYSNYFIPLSLTFTDGKTPILPRYRKNIILEAMKYGVVDPAKIVDALPKLGLADVLKKNHFKPPSGDPAPLIEPSPATRDPHHDPAHPSGDSIRADLNDIRHLIRMFSEKASPTDAGMIRVMERKLANVSSSAAAMVRTNDRARTEVTTSNTIVRNVTKTTPETDDVEFFLGLLKSDVGYLFLDRTR